MHYRQHIFDASGPPSNDPTGAAGYGIVNRPDDAFDFPSGEELQATAWLRQNAPELFRPRMSHDKFIRGLSNAVREAVRAACREARTYIALSGRPIGWQPDRVHAFILQTLYDLQRIQTNCVGGKGRPSGKQAHAGRKILQEIRGHIPQARRTVMLRPTRKLGDAQVVHMRHLYAAGGIGYKLLGQRFGVSPALVQQVVQGMTYRDVPGPIYWPGRGVFPSLADARGSLCLGE